MEEPPLIESKRRRSSSTSSHHHRPPPKKRIYYSSEEDDDDDDHSFIEVISPHPPAPRKTRSSWSSSRASTTEQSGGAIGDVLTLDSSSSPGLPYSYYDIGVVGTQPPVSSSLLTSSSTSLTPSSSSRAPFSPPAPLAMTSPLDLLGSHAPSQPTSRREQQQHESAAPSSKATTATEPVHPAQPLTKDAADEKKTSRREQQQHESAAPSSEATTATEPVHPAQPLTKDAADEKKRQRLRLSRTTPTDSLAWVADREPEQGRRSFKLNRPSAEAKEDTKTPLWSTTSAEPSAHPPRRRSSPSSSSQAPPSHPPAPGPNTQFSSSALKKKALAESRVEMLEETGDPVPMTRSDARPLPARAVPAQVPRSPAKAPQEPPNRKPPPTVPEDKENRAQPTNATKTSAPPAPPSKTTTTTTKPPAPKKLTFEAKVWQFMLMSFQPWTLKGLADKVDSTETALQYVMLSLKDKGVVMQKDFTSSKGSKVKTLYWANHGAKAKELHVDMASPSEIAQARQELTQLQTEEAHCRQSLASVLETPSNDDLRLQLIQAEEKIRNMEKSLVDLKERIRTTKKPLASTTGPARGKGPAELAKAKCPRRLKIRINKMRAEWKSRKEKCMDFVHQVADGMEKKPKEVIQLLDLETDEMVGVTLPPPRVVD